jgi:intracellular sulfur oxidation DsrE/DsrF family protein
MSHKLKQVAMLLASSMMLVTSAANADAQVPATAVADAPHAEHYVAPHIPHDEFQTIKLVVPVTTDAPDVVGMKLRNIQNGINAAAQWQGNVKATVVLYAKGVHILENPTPALKLTLDTLRKEGVTVAVCGNSLREQNLDYHTLYGVVESDIVPSGFLEVALLQQHKGYSVDPAN